MYLFMYLFKVSIKGREDGCYILSATVLTHDGEHDSNQAKFDY